MANYNAPVAQLSPSASDAAAANEFEFWGRQATEHALFLQLGFEDPALKAYWQQMYEALKAAYEQGDVNAFMVLLDQSVTAKQELLKRLHAGEWLGWLFPTFVDHVTHEEEYFAAKLRGSIASNIETGVWLRFMAEHAEFASHLVDTTERAAMMKALELAGQFHGLEAACMRDCGASLAALSAQKGKELDAFFTGTTPTKPLSVIHPVLREHVIREGRRFVDVMNRLSSVPVASVAGRFGYPPRFVRR